MIVARWDTSLLLGVVEVCKGTHLDSMGKRGKVDLLYIEEVLFLLEKGRLCLRLPTSEDIVSIGLGWSLLETTQISLETYLVYSSLKSTGNIVFRTGEIFYDGVEHIKSTNITTFDVWAPSSSPKFSRKAPPLPTFHVVIMDSSQSDKDFSVMVAVSKLISERRVNIKIATARDGLVDFFEASTPSLPTLVP